jgi:hypothetical protein
MKVSHKRRDSESTEVVLTIEFDPQNSNEQNFKAGLVKGLSPEAIRKQIANGNKSALISFEISNINTVVLTGCGDFINSQFVILFSQVPVLFDIAKKIYKEANIQSYRDLGMKIHPDRKENEAAVEKAQENNRCKDLAERLLKGELNLTQYGNTFFDPVAGDIIDKRYLELVKEMPECKNDEKAVAAINDLLSKLSNTQTSKQELDFFRGGERKDEAVDDFFGVKKEESEKPQTSVNAGVVKNLTSANKGNTI